MTEQEAIARMVAPGTPRAGKYRSGVIQVWLTRACDKACYGCTQGSNLAGPSAMMTPTQFEEACKSLKGYWGVVGVFGGNPAVNPHFEEICEILRGYFPKEQRGLWCNNPLGKGAAMRATFDPAVSNLNVHLDKKAFDEFKRDWPESRPFGLDKDSRHSPCYVAMKDVLKKFCPTCGGNGWHTAGGNDPADCGTCYGTGKVYDEPKAWELISNCDINKHWSAMIGVFRGQLRAWFCEIAGAQSILHQWDSKACECGNSLLGCSICDAYGHENGRIFDYPDTGINLENYAKYNRIDRLEGTDVSNPIEWWQRSMGFFRNQVKKHCHECGVPLRGHGENAQSDDPSACEEVSETHKGIFNPKRKGRRVSLVVTPEQLGPPLERMTNYLQNSTK